MPNHPSDVRKEIERRLALHAEAHASQDLERALQLYTKDAVVRPANMEPVSGHSQLRQFFSKWWSAMTIEEIRYTTVELHVHGIAAYQIGTYEGVQKPHGQESKVDRGSFMIVLELSRGRLLEVTQRYLQQQPACGRHNHEESLMSSSWRRAHSSLICQSITFYNHHREDRTRWYG